MLITSVFVFNVSSLCPIGTTSFTAFIALNLSFYFSKNPALQTVPEHSIIKSLQGSDENGQQESFKEKHTMGQ